MTNLLDNTSSLKKETQAEKYLFDTEFGCSETSDDIQSITPKQLSAANTAVSKKSYKQGYDNGVQETNDGITRMAGDQMFVITAKVEELIETERGLLETFHVQVAQVCELVTSKVMPALLDQGAFEEIKSIIGKAYASLPQDKKITIRVHQSFVELIAQHIETFQKENDAIATIDVKAGEDFDRSDCTISWDGAGIEHYAQSVIQEIKETLLRLSGKPLEDSPEPAQENEDQVIEEGKE